MNVKMVQCLLTRRCNLNCSYCGIAGDIEYAGRPVEYPYRKTLTENEMSPGCWIDTLTRYHRHDPSVYFVLWGGEPFLVPDSLTEIVQALNGLDARYTISTNATGKIVTDAIRRFFDTVGKVDGFTVSVDPGFELEDGLPNGCEREKSISGFDVITEVVNRDLAKDPCAVMTLSRESAVFAPATMRHLIDHGISVFLNLLSTQKTPYYDFPGEGTWNPCELDEATRHVFDSLRALPEEQQRLHTTAGILDRMLSILPEEFDCEVEHNLHNITIEPDGALRMCCNIRGVSSPLFRTEQVLGQDGGIVAEGLAGFMAAVAADKNQFCERCALTCMMMSKFQDADAIGHSR